MKNIARFALPSSNVEINAYKKKTTLKLIVLAVPSHFYAILCYKYSRFEIRTLQNYVIFVLCRLIYLGLAVIYT